MKATFFTLASLVSLALGNLIVERSCAGNNCNRALTGTRSGLTPLSSRKADCSTFMASTVTPPATTITVTVDVTAPASTIAGTIAKRGLNARATPTIPPYLAPACKDAKEVSSACSCFGVTATVTTLLTPTVTMTSTVDYCEDL